MLQDNTMQLDVACRLPNTWATKHQGAAHHATAPFSAPAFTSEKAQQGAEIKERVRNDSPTRMPQQYTTIHHFYERSFHHACYTSSKERVRNRRNA